MQGVLLGVPDCQKDLNVGGQANEKERTYNDMA
jgi:hypothetical protein